MSITDERKKTIKTVPGSLEESIAALEHDHQFLLEGDVFTPDVIETWIAMKRGKLIIVGALVLAAAGNAPSTQALASAFQDDPVIAWIFPDEQRRRAVLPAFMEFRLRKPAPACAVPTGRHLRHRPTAVPRNRRRVDHGTHAQLARPSRSPAGPG